MVYKFNAGPGANPFNLAAPDYTIYTFTNGTWSPGAPAVGITEAVFIFEPPQVTIRGIGNGLLMLEWPTNVPNCLLQSTTNLSSGVWATNRTPPVVVNGNNRVTNTISASQQFFRLVH